MFERNFDRRILKVFVKLDFRKKITKLKFFAVFNIKKCGLLRKKQFAVELCFCNIYVCCTNFLSKRNFSFQIRTTVHRVYRNIINSDYT